MVTEGLIAFGAAAVAALVAGLISLVGLVISKDQKVSEFRQAWIDALREDIADVITYAHAIRGSAQFNSNIELWSNAKEDFLRINEAAARIKLRLNANEGPSKAALDVLEKHEILFANAANRPDLSELDVLEVAFLESARVVLKQEWIRVRSGEISYRVSKWTAIVMVILCFLVIIISVTLVAFAPLIMRN